MEIPQEHQHLRKTMYFRKILDQFRAGFWARKTDTTRENFGKAPKSRSRIPKTTRNVGFSIGSQFLQDFPISIVFWRFFHQIPVSDTNSSWFPN